MSIRFEDRVAIVTGAGAGLGRSHALGLAARGAKVVVNDLAAADAVVAEIQSAGGEAIADAANVANFDEVQAMVKKTMDTWGRVDILVNNAGILRDKSFAKMPIEDFQSVINVHLNGSFNCTKAVWEIMRQQEYGRIVMTTSSSGLYGNFGQTNYVATKSGVIGMTKVWARELGRKGIRVNAVAPGFIATEMIETVPEKVIEKVVGQTPLARMGEPEDIANAYVFLSSHLASFISGTVLSVDGGIVI